MDREDFKKMKDDLQTFSSPTGPRKYNGPIKISPETAAELKEAFADLKGKIVDLYEIATEPETMIFYENEDEHTISWNPEEWKAYEVDQSRGFMTLKRRKE